MWSGQEMKSQVGGKWDISITKQGLGNWLLLASKMPTQGQLKFKEHYCIVSWILITFFPIVDFWCMYSSSILVIVWKNRFQCGIRKGDDLIIFVFICPFCICTGLEGLCNSSFLRYAFLTDLADLADLQVDFYSLLLFVLIIWQCTHNLVNTGNITLN